MDKKDDKNTIEINSISFKDHTKRNITDPHVIVGTMILIVLFSIQYACFQVGNDSAFWNFMILDCVLTFFNLIALSLVSTNRNVMVWLGYSIISKILSVVFSVLGHDATLGTIGSSDSTIILTFKIIGHLITFASSLLAILLLPLILSAIFFNYLDAMFLIKMNKKYYVWWWATITIIEVACYWALYKYAIYEYYLQGSKSLFDEMVINSSSKKSMEHIFVIIKPLLAFVFMPLLFSVNKNKRADIFYAKTYQFYAGIQITFLIQYINMLIDYDQMYIPKIMVALISLQLLFFTVISIRTIYFNKKDFRTVSPIPYRFSLKKKHNTFFKVIYMYIKSKENKKIKGQL